MFHEKSSSTTTRVNQMITTNQALQTKNSAPSKTEPETTKKKRGDEKKNELKWTKLDPTFSLSPPSDENEID